MSLTIGGSPIATPTTFVVTDTPIERTARLASGKLVKELIATKKRFSLQYADISGSNLSTLLGYLAAAAFVTLGYPNETTTTTATVTAGEIPRDLWSNSGSKRYRDVTIELIEQ